MSDDRVNIYSWNVNGLRAIERKGFAQWISATGPDVLGLQEVRAAEADIPQSVRSLFGAHSGFVSASRKGYSGVGLFSRFPAEIAPLSIGEPFDEEGRLQAARIGKLTVVNGYFPNGNGKGRDNSRVPFKLDFYRALFEALQPRVDAGEPILVLGDFNTAHRAIDLARPKQNLKTSGFLPEECEALDHVLRSGWVDTFRHFEPGAGHYTWWSQRMGVREKNIGWRIDYILASPGAMAHVKAARIHPEVYGSDHCPISVELDSAVLI